VDILELREKNNIEEWNNYSPWIIQYTKYLPNVICASEKICDVYWQFSNARASIDFMDFDDYGQLIGRKDYLHTQYIRSKFLFDALAYYNYCIDLSWQVLFFYFGDHDYGMLQDKNRYEKTAKECNEGSLRLLLWFRKQNKIADFIFTFFNSSQTKEIREIYNYLKHRGTFYIDGLGLNDEFLPIGLNGSRLRMINRKEIDLYEWKDKLIQFDVSFVNYFNCLIKWIMPSDFKENNGNLNDHFELLFRLKEWEKNRNLIRKDNYIRAFV
jgi:hypothetical protein